MVEDFVKDLRPAVEILIRKVKTLTELNDHLTAQSKYWQDDAMWWMEQCEKKAPEMFEDAG